MSEPTQQALEAALAAVIDPTFGKPLGELGTLSAVTLSGTVGALVTAGGTHRAVPPGARGGASVRDGAAVGGGSAAGLRELARTGALPRAAINAKGGAPGPLHVEPGSLYLLVEVHGDWGPVLAHPADAPLAGAPACLGALVDAIEAWRCAHIAVARASTGDGTIATDVAIGALDAGLAAKPDLVPAGVRVHLHVVTLPGDNPDAVASSLAAALCAAPRLAPFHDRIQVMPYGELPAGRTAVAHPLVRAADRAWRAVLGDHDVRDWRGATDGAYLRHVGVPTVRIGPPLSSDPEDRRRERVRLDDLRAIASVWTRTAIDHLTGTA